MHKTRKCNKIKNKIIISFYQKDDKMIIAQIHLNPNLGVPYFRPEPHQSRGRWSSYLVEIFKALVLPGCAVCTTSSSYINTLFILQSDIRAVHSASAAGELSLLEEKEKSVKGEVFQSRDRRGFTPLHRAVGLDREETVEFLLSRAAPPDLAAEDWLGRAPLHYAALLSDPDHALYTRLVEAGADPSAADQQGRTAEQYLELEMSPQDTARLLELPEEARAAALSGRKSPSRSPSKRGSSPSKRGEGSPSKGRRQPSRAGKVGERGGKLLAAQSVPTPQQLQDWAKTGQVAKLETTVFQGRGDLVISLGKAWNEDVRNFLKKVPILMVKPIFVVNFKHLLNHYFKNQINEVHQFVEKGDTETLKKIEVSFHKVLDFHTWEAATF